MNEKEGQELSLIGVLLTGLVMLLVYGPFIFSSYNSKEELRAKTFIERFNEGENNEI